MSLVQYGMETEEKTGSFAAEAKGNPVVALAALWSSTISTFSSKLSLLIVEPAQQLPEQIWGCRRQSCSLLEQL